ncbi:MAG: hypothetical protein LBD78_04060 [Spirochaetaceae bacterium]|jgi:hypothetical protein|nr:hypothetical protein [Spirochaetaceae bacterium]
MVKDGEIGIIWQGGIKYQRQVVNVRLRTSVLDVVHALEVSGVSPDSFNKMISGVSFSEYLPCTLFVKDSKFGAVLKVLQEEGRCFPYK